MFFKVGVEKFPTSELGLIIMITTCNFIDMNNKLNFLAYPNLGCPYKDLYHHILIE